MKKLLITTSIILTVIQLYAQEKVEFVQMNPSRWEITNDSEARFEVFDNTETLLLDGKVFVKNQLFSNGTIDVDVYAKDTRSFAGIVFRRELGMMDEVYLRMHKSGQLDAVQYTPTFHDDLSWQLYREYQAKISFKREGWNKLRIEVMGNQATVFVNNTKVLNIDRLKSGVYEGEIGLFALFENRFANFKFTAQGNTSEDNQVKNLKSNNSAVITNWNLSRAFKYQKGIKFDKFFNVDYINVTTDDSGLLPLAKYIKKVSSGNFDNNEEAFAIAKTTIISEIDQVKVFSFDYSDKIMVYLNDEPIFWGDNSFRSKGPQFQGHIDINSNSIYLNLNKGENVLHCAIIERANGWGLIGKIE